jgi:AcrR family transcriptional regulator
VSGIDSALDAEPRPQRERIVEVALHLMSESGVHAMSMRRLADACGLNVATIYHYFPSKAALLDDVIASRSYAELLAHPPPIDVGLEPTARLSALLRWLWTEMASQDDVWRLLLGESLRGEPQALTSAAELSATFERALEEWMTTYFGDLPGDSTTTARVLRGVIYGFFVEHLPLPAGDRERILAKRADEVAKLLAPPSASPVARSRRA